MSKLKSLWLIWLGGLHVAFAISLMFNYLYVSDNYALIKIDRLQQQESAQDVEYQRQQESYALALAQGGAEAKTDRAAKSAFDVLQKHKGKR